MMSTVDNNSKRVYFDPRSEATVTLSLVVPVFNEVETVGLFLDRVMQVFVKISSINLDIVFVNDGSSDNTLGRLLELQKSNSSIRIVDLSRNFGKEAALTVGLKAAVGQVVVPIDVDLQDPPELILNMLEKWREGFDVVLGKRINRSSDSWIKQASAIWFYRLHNKIADLEIPENIGDFRLMDRVVIDALVEAKPLLSASHSKQVVEAKINGIPTNSVILTAASGGKFEVVIPAKVKEQLKHNSLLKLQLHFPDAARPVDIGINSDERKLAVGLVALTVFNHQKGSVVK